MDSHFILELPTSIDISFFTKKPDFFNRNENQINFEAMLEEILPKLQSSTVSVGNENMVDKNVRKSGVYDNLYINLENEPFHFEDKFSDTIKKIIPFNFRHADYYLYNIFGCTKKWEMLVYDKDDFFSKHSDGKINDRHFATILLLPPQNIMPHTGGHLIIYDGQIKYEVCAHATNWLLVGFPINVSHECTNILSGMRIVFKTNFCIPQDIYDIFKATDSNDSDSIDSNNNNILSLANKCQTKKELEDEIEIIDDELARLESTKKEIEEKTFELLEKKKELEREMTVYDYQKLVDRIVSCEEKVVLVALEKRYETTNINMLIGEDYRLFMELDKQIQNKMIKLLNFTVEHNMLDENRCELVIKSSYDRYKFPNVLGIDNEKYLILHQDTNSNHPPGKLIRCGLEYNDNTYDTVYYFKMTSILIIKN